MDINEANRILERATPPKVGNSYLVKALAWAIDEVGILRNRLGVDNEKDALLSSMRESGYMAMELEKALAERDKLMAWVHDLQLGMYINCVYCGHRYGPKDEVPSTMADALKAHVEACEAHPMSALKRERDELVRRIEAILDRLPEGGVWCYACNRATVPVWGEEPYEHIPLEYGQMKTTFRCSICKRETHAKDSCVDSLRAIAEGRGL